MNKYSTKNRFYFKKSNISNTKIKKRNQTKEINKYFIEYMWLHNNSIGFDILMKREFYALFYVQRRQCQSKCFSRINKSSEKAKKVRISLLYLLQKQIKIDWISNGFIVQWKDRIARSMSKIISKCIYFFSSSSPSLPISCLIHHRFLCFKCCLSHNQQ